LVDRRISIRGTAAATLLSALLFREIQTIDDMLIEVPRTSFPPIRETLKHCGEELVVLGNRHMPRLGPIPFANQSLALN
jgi:uncharacterized protein (UPF0216 family)